VTENDAANPTPRRWEKLRGYYTRTRAVIAAAVAVLLSGFAILEGVFNLFPGLRDEPCPSEREATITPLELEATVTREEALDLEGASKEGLSAERLAQPGKFVSFDVVSVGFRDDPVQVWSRVRVGGGPLVGDLEIRNQLVETVQPDECKDRDHVDVWTALPAEAGSYVIEVRLRDPDGEWLHAARTDAFDA
jgi:hypothetical protein